MNNHAFWKGKKVFLTGHTGFKGAWLCLWLHTLGAKVSGYALDPPTTPDLFTSARIGDLLERDIRAAQDCTAARNVPHWCQWRAGRYKHISTRGLQSHRSIGAPLSS